MPVDAEHCVVPHAKWPRRASRAATESHLAVMDRIGLTHIISADRGFDAVPGITRLDRSISTNRRGEVFGA